MCFICINDKVYRSLLQKSPIKETIFCEETQILLRGCLTMVCIYISMYIHIKLYVYVYTYKVCVYIYILVCIYLYPSHCVGAWRWYVYTYFIITWLYATIEILLRGRLTMICINISIYIHIYTYVPTYICIDPAMRAFDDGMYIHTYAYTY